VVEQGAAVVAPRGIAFGLAVVEVSTIVPDLADRRFAAVGYQVAPRGIAFGLAVVEVSTGALDLAGRRVASVGYLVGPFHQPYLAFQEYPLFDLASGLNRLVPCSLLAFWDPAHLVVSLDYKPLE